MSGLYKIRYPDGSRGKYWYIDCYFRGRRYRWSTGYEGKGAAKTVLRSAEERMAEGREPWATSGPRIGDLLDGYLDYQRHRRVARTTLEDRERYLKRFTEHFGKYMLTTEITSSAAMDYQEGRLTDGASNTLINREMAAIRHYFNYARRRGLCDTNPFSRFEALPEPRRDPRILSREERQTWFNWCLKINPNTGKENDPILYDLSVIAIYTGLRPSDTKKIRGADVDTKAATITVTFAKLRGTKTATIPLHDEALHVLSRLKEERGDGYLFPGRSGGHVKSFRWRVNRARRETGLQDFTFGQFRHNCATWLLANGVSIYTIKEILGHASVRTTEERYAKLVGTETRDAINLLPSLGQEQPE